MSFRISNLQLCNFRNYKKHSIDFDDTLTILCGSNAVGKTSIIEAIQMLCEATSFRKPSFVEMIRHGAEDASLTLYAGNNARERTVELLLEPHKKTFKVNGKKASAVEGILGMIPVVVFTPDNLGLVKDSASKRRRELDGLGGQLSKNYARLCREYDKALRGRNRLLQDGYSADPAFEAWTDQLVVIGAALYQHRMKLVDRLAPLIKAQHEELDPLTILDIAYTNNWGADSALSDDRDQIENRFREALEESIEEELGRKLTQAGPHRDDVVFTLDGHDARTFGSQGQQRTIALSWKLAQVNIVEEVLGIQPILLLDDVMSELDKKRRHALTTQVGKVAQTIITTTNIDYFDKELLARAEVVVINKDDRESDGGWGGKPFAHDESSDNDAPGDDGVKTGTKASAEDGSLSDV